MKGEGKILSSRNCVYDSWC